MKSILLLLTTLLLAATFRLAATPPPPAAEAITGKWLTADKQGTIQIYQQQNRFFGKIVGPQQNQLDTKNPNKKLQSRPILGAVILQNFRFDGQGTWEDGTVYDPNNGKTYSCSMKLRNANTLEVRGYIGFSLIGRTEVWTRVP